MKLKSGDVKSVDYAKIMYGQFGLYKVVSISNNATKIFYRRYNILLPKFRYKLTTKNKNLRKSFKFIF